MTSVLKCISPNGGSAVAERIATLGECIRTATVFVNESGCPDPRLRWTGFGNKDKAVALSHMGRQHVTRPKTFHFEKA